MNEGMSLSFEAVILVIILEREGPRSRASEEPVQALAASD